jgi:hypothetical protein
MALRFRAIDLTSPINRIAAGFVAVCQNVRERARRLGIPFDEFVRGLNAA